MRHNVIPLLGSLILLTGCLSVGPDYQRPDVELPDAWRGAAANDALPASAATSRWWTLYNDATLERLVDEAYAHNHDLVIAAARVEEARAQLGIARADQLPVLAAEVGGTRARQSERGATPVSPGTNLTTTTHRADLTLAFELDFWGKYRRASEAARAELLATEAARDTVSSALAAEVARAYFALVALDAQVASTRRVVERGRESLELQQKRYQAGVISEFEYQQRAAEVESNAVQLPVLERERGRQERALAVLLGRSPRALMEDTVARADRGGVAPAIPADLPSQLLLARPDLREAEQRLIAANARIGVARAAYFPSISLTGALGRQSTELSDLFTSPARTWSFIGNVTQPIFAGGRLSNQTRAAEARREQLLAQYRLAIVNAFREVLDAIESQQRALEVLQTEARRARALERAYQLAQLRYQNGVASQLDVIDAERQLLQAELNRIDAQRASRASVADLYRALGAGTSAREGEKSR
jgi:outer membrane protein, multidrug efflux system